MMDSHDIATSKAQQAGDLWRQGNYVDARRLYEEVLSITSLPLDKAKTLANIAQMYEKEGLKEDAIRTAEKAINVIHADETYKTLEGSHLRGYLNGFLNRLQGKDRYAPPKYDDSVPLEMNLSIPDRLRAHFSIAIIAGGLSGTIGSQIPISRLDIIMSNGSIIVYSIAGIIFGWAATSTLLQQTVMSLCILKNKPMHECLRPAINLLTITAISYLVLMPFVLSDLLIEVVWFTVSGALGFIFFIIFIMHHHAKRID